MIDFAQLIGKIIVFELLTLILFSFTLLFTIVIGAGVTLIIDFWNYYYVDKKG